MVEILREGLKDDNIQFDFTDLKCSIGSLSLHIFEKYFNKYNIVGTSDCRTYECERFAYAGGVV